MKMADKYRQQGRQEIIDQIPTSWLDPLFSEYLGEREFTPKDIEDIFVKLKKRCLIATQGDANGN